MRDMGGGGAAACEAGTEPHTLPPPPPAPIQSDPIRGSSYRIAVGIVGARLLFNRFERSTGYPFVTCGWFRILLGRRRGCFALGVDAAGEAWKRKADADAGDQATGSTNTLLSVRLLLL
jgi:hypothetical protein